MVGPERDHCQVEISRTDDFHLGIDAPIRCSGEFGDVVVRVSPSYRLEMHVDTDEGNAAELSLRDEGVLAATGRQAHLRRRGTALDRPAE